MPMRVAVIGAGLVGDHGGLALRRERPTIIWARRPELAEQIRTEHANGDYLKGYELTPSSRPPPTSRRRCASADLLVMGVPSHGFRSTLER
jgi:glycerol-3-phosphate dehydrogenase (NAD(P)+)